MVKIETERLFLREMVENDFEPLRRVLGDRDIMRHYPYEFDDERIRKVLTTILESGHLSTLEHASYTFAIDGVSRALTHQLVRHRLASFNQQSQRYVKFTERLCVNHWKAIPKLIMYASCENTCQNYSDAKSPR